MIDNKDFDYIKDKFDSDGLKAPESLSEDAISKMLDAAFDRCGSMRCTCFGIDPVHEQLQSGRRRNSDRIG